MYDTFPQTPHSTVVPPRRHTGLWIVTGILGVLLAAGVMAWTGIATYNQLQYNEARVGYAWHQVINQYTRRSELVPNLVAVVRSYASHETELFNQITATRTRLNGLAVSARDGRDPQQVAQFQAAQSQLSAQLGRLLVVAERYPDVKSAALYQDLMAQLEGTENRLAYARQQYFASLTDYNLGLVSFPGNLLAGRVGMQHKQAIALDDDKVVRPAAPIDLK